MNIAVIPARGGSKRIPRKNIKEFCGKPMIAWSIEAAQKSNCFERIIVSTDDNEIADIAQNYDAEVPFMRPESLANDYAGTIPVIRHAVEWLVNHGEKPENVCCLYATAPFVCSQDLRRGLEILQAQECDYAFSVTSFPFPIQRAIRITQEQRVEMFQPEHFMTRSQDLEEAYHDAGQFYWGTAQAWLDEKPVFSDHSIPIVLPRHRVQDIDTLEDWQRAEWLFKALHAK
ncbi:MAG: pseudaminic acid cytidylyltransferase [Thiomicrorhabdus sp.]|jgi:pseudaminic acid cytidylyltransferase|nr:pseudaminic acid cytidylyltransferase [Thiomicrorhabdus sp.]